MRLFLDEAANCANQLAVFTLVNIFSPMGYAQLQICFPKLSICIAKLYFCVRTCLVATCYDMCVWSELTATYCKIPISVPIKNIVNNKCDRCCRVKKQLMLFTTALKRSSEGELKHIMGMRKTLDYDSLICLYFCILYTFHVSRWV